MVQLLIHTSEQQGGELMGPFPERQQLRAAPETRVRVVYRDCLHDFSHKIEDRGSTASDGEENAQPQPVCREGRVSRCFAEIWGTTQPPTYMSLSLIKCFCKKSSKNVFVFNN